MNSEEFRQAGRQMIDFIADYLDNIRDRPVLPSVEPFYIQKVVPESAPEKPETWESVFSDIEPVVMDGMTHWHSPQFHAYFPTANSYPAILGGLLSDALSCIGFTWYSSPACTELEMQMCNWLCKALGLPSFYEFKKGTTGGGVIQGSMSEATVVTMLSAKKMILNHLKRKMEQLERRRLRLLRETLEASGLESEIPICNGHPSTQIKDCFKQNSKSDVQAAESKNSSVKAPNEPVRPDSPSNLKHWNLMEMSEVMEDHLEQVIKSQKINFEQTVKLVAYCSAQAHSSVEKAGLLSSVIIHPVQPSCKSHLGLDGESLEKAIQEDLAAGMVPFYVAATLGTTSTLAFDKLNEIGPICRKYSVWLHVDAAYAGAAFVCPEYRHYMRGIEFTDSFAMNPHKWLLINFDCSMLWVKNYTYIDNAMNVSPIYLKHDKAPDMADYRHWQIPLGRRFRSLKIWFVMRTYGISGLQDFIRKHIRLAREFATMVEKDNRFEITHPVTFGLVCFRLIGSNDYNERLLKLINERKHIHMMPTFIDGRYILRFAVCSRFTESGDIDYAFQEILKTKTVLDTQLDQENGNSKESCLCK